MLSLPITLASSKEFDFATALQSSGLDNCPP